MKYYIFATALFILILIGVAYLYYLSQFQDLMVRPNISTFYFNWLTCKVTGGRWETAGIYPEFRCIHKYPDGGKSCRSSTECRGLCISKGDGTGYCKYDDNPFGCYSTVEDFREGRGVYCID